jgi:hypothetical protein
MPGLSPKSLPSLALALFALAVALDGVLVTAGSRAPAWSHWWCSPSAPHTAPHGAAGGLAATLLAPVSALAPHWPHLLPVLLGLATLVYLRRANTRYHARGALAVTIRGVYRR